MKRGYWITLSVSLLALIGYWMLNRPEPGPAMARVKGTVRFDGVPLEKGLIQFKPATVEGPMASLPIKNGEYEGEACVAISRVSVTARRVKSTRKADDSPNSPDIEELEEVLPPHCNIRSRLSADIKPGKNDIDFTLTTAPPPDPVLTTPTPPKESPVKEPAGTDSPAKEPASTPSTGPAPTAAPTYAPQPALDSSADIPALTQLVVRSCQTLAILVLIVEFAGAVSLVIDEWKNLKRASRKNDGASAEAPPLERNATALWTKMALLVAGAVCIVALLTTAEMVRLVVRMDQRGERMEQRMEYLSRTR